MVARGATCYLNALLQALYMTPELRDGLFSVDPRALHVDLVRAGWRPCHGLRAVTPAARATQLGAQSAGSSSSSVESGARDPGKKRHQPRVVPLELQRLFTNLQLANRVRRGPGAPHAGPGPHMPPRRPPSIPTP